MTIVLRSVKGSNLTPNEVDGNFTDLDDRVIEIETNPPEAIGITNIIQSGTQFSIHVGETVYGPFTIPSTLMRFVGEWDISTAYAENDLVEVPGYGLFLVLQDHTSDGTAFDPDDGNTSGDYYIKVFGIGIESIVTWGADTHTLSNLSYIGRYIRYTNAAGCAITVPLNSETAYPIGTVITLFGSIGVLTIAEGSTEPTFNYPPSKALATAEPGSMMTLVKVDDDEWDVGGYLADVSA
jgi:hypothetical protein